MSIDNSLISHMKNYGELPGTTTLTERSSLDDAYELLQYATELLVSDVLTKGTFIKLKYLIDTMDGENHTMARKIMDAKTEK